MTTITLVEPYNPAWPDWFAQIRAILLPAVGDVCLTIEHVGSTSIPGIVAKPIIDLDIVTVPGGFAPVKARLESLGYFHEGDLGLPDREAFALLDESLKAQLPRHHLYVCPEDAFELKKHLAFRNFLRENPQVAQRLSQHKLALAKEFNNDLDAYIEGKSAMVQEITDLAIPEFERKANG